MIGADTIAVDWTPDRLAPLWGLPLAVVGGRESMSRRHTLHLLLALAALAAGPAAAESVAERIHKDPKLLRSFHTQQELRRSEPVSYRPLMASLAADASLDWDLRAWALSFSGPKLPPAVLASFGEDFATLEVARSSTGAETFNILAAWLRRSAEPAAEIAALITPQRPGDGAAPLLTALAGRPLHPYLQWLDELGFVLRADEIERLGETDDQLTRQLLCWQVGRDHRQELAGFLLAQITSQRSNSMRSQADRVLLAVLTVGIGELIRQAAPTPPWLGDDATPKGMALESLVILLPEGQVLSDPDLVDPLFEAAATNARGRERGQWRLAVDILDFLHRRRVPLAGAANGAVAGLARQVLHKRGPLEAFVAAEGLHREAGVPWPELSVEERSAVWSECFKTLDAAYLGAVVRALPDTGQRQALESHLLGQAPAAARGTLHVVRCWGADIEGPGEWAMAVAELGLTEAIASVEQVLHGAWNDKAALALSRLGPEGARALARFLRTPEAHRLDRETRDGAVRACAEQLPEDQWQELQVALARDPYLRDSLPPISP